MPELAYPLCRQTVTLYHPDAAAGELLHQADQVGQAAGQAVGRVAPEGVALAHVGQACGEPGPVAVPAAGLILEQLVHLPQVLAVEALVGAGNAAVADGGCHGSASRDAGPHGPTR